MNNTTFFLLQAFKAELTEKLKIVEQIRSTFNQLHGDDVTSSAHQTTQVLHKAKLDAIDETGAAQQLRNMYQVTIPYKTQNSKTQKYEEIKQHL